MQPSKQSIVALAMLVLAAVAGGAAAQTQSPSPANAQAPALAVMPWMDTSLSPDRRADLIQAQMTQDEVFTLMRGNNWQASAGYVPGIPRLGIPDLRESDASLGVANGGHMRPGDTAIALPASVLTASTWNVALAHDAGVMLGTEIRGKGFNVVLDGGVNLARDPRGGRTFEYAGEDPLLAGVIASEVILGAQKQHVISTVKHYALNDQESGRFTMSANIDEGPMRESDLLAFEIAIERGNPGAIMCAYNRVNGIYSCENDFLLNRVLKGDWAYPGFVLSDWGAVHSAGLAANSGLDQESAAKADSQPFFGDPLKQAVASGEVSAARVHDMAHRILRSMFAQGLFDFPFSPQPVAAEADAAIAGRVAEEGIVLLKNGTSVLPLSKPKRIVVIGAHADIGVLSGGGSSQVIPVGDTPEQEIFVPGPISANPKKGAKPPGDIMIYDPPSPLAAIRAQAPDADVSYDDGTDIARAAVAAKDADVAIVFGQQWMREGRDVPNLSLPGDQDALIDAVAGANPRTVIVLETGGPVLMPWLSKAASVLEAWYPGQGGAEAIARILFGAANPSGHLAVTFPMHEDQLPHPSAPSTIRTSADLAYTEGANVGYRWFEAQNLAPLFPFGYGLSYTTFRFSKLVVRGGAALTASFDVTNRGARAGKAVAQVYLEPPQGPAREVRRLIGWSKMDLKPGETRRVTIAADPRLLAHFDVPTQMWHVAAGNYLVSLCGSSADPANYLWVHMDERTIKP